MKKHFACVLCVFLLFLCGCSADPDIILQNGTSAAESVAAESTDSFFGEESDPGNTDQSADAEIESESAQTEANESGMVCAYICGAVLNPGVYEMDEPARICQLVELAGGLTADADEQSVNLARFVEDGEMVWIPTKEESAAGVTAAQETVTDASVSDSSGEDSGKVNINTADVSELTTLNGIGDTKAEAIIAWREEHGDFGSVEEIMQVNGIAEGTYEKIKDYITV